MSLFFHGTSSLRYLYVLVSSFEPEIPAGHPKYQKTQILA